MSDAAPMAILRDDRDLVGVAISVEDLNERDLIFDVHMLARDEPDEAPVPFLSAFSYREPLAGLRGLLDDLAGAVTGEVTALRHDPISDGLSMELKAQRGGQGFEVVVWLDLTRMSPAMKARATRGRHQSGLRFFCTRSALEDFRSQLASFVAGPRVFQ